MGAADIAILKGIGFFADLSDFDLAQIAGLTEARSYRAGELIVEERTAAERFFIIIRGKIQISKRFADGDEFVLACTATGSSSGKWGCWTRAALGHGRRGAHHPGGDHPHRLRNSPVQGSASGLPILRELSSRLRNRGPAGVLPGAQKRPNPPRHLQTIEGFLHRARMRRRRMVQRARELVRAAGREMGLLEEEVLIAEIGVVLRALRIPAEPPALPAPPSSRAARVAAACEGFAELPADGGSPPSPQEVKRRLGQRFDAETSAALLKLWQEGRLPAEAAGASL
jgi:CRP-like cAMP-binding protein